VQEGILDVALCGKDWLEERGVSWGTPDKGDEPVVLISDLIYSKVSNRKARWVLAVAGNSPYKCAEDLAGKRISTELVDVSLNSDRPVVLCDTLVRVSPKFSLAMHIDADEGNASGWNKKVAGTIVARKGK